LDSLNDEGPDKLRDMSFDNLNNLAEEVRWQVLDAVSVTGGHLGSALGVVDLTVALHHVFDTPSDEIVWDVSHQVYPHKVLTGRRGRIYTLRQQSGLSGFCKRSESEYDAFIAGHSSTSISAALGFQVARDLKNEQGHSVAVIGDGAITGGMAWEAMNHAGGIQSKMIVILNDNGQVSLPTVYNNVDEPVGALSVSLQNGEQVGELFEGFGFSYVGPIDGHNMETLVDVLQNAKNNHAEGLVEKPILLHVKTQKGKGYAPAEVASDNLHAVRPNFNKKVEMSTPLHREKAAERPALTTVFAESLVKEGERDEKIVAITAAMPGGTGVGIFEKRFGSERTFDVGIAEQHAVTFAAGLAASDFKPFVCIYSTFLQRGFDQVVHDVALQNLPVRFVLDRAGLVGGDGPTHEGAFDLSFLACIPNLKICAPANEVELVHMTHTLAKMDDCPSVMRYPRASSSTDAELPDEPLYLEPGKGRIVREGSDGVVAILSVGSRLGEALKAAQRLESWGINATVADARWVKPLDGDLVTQLAESHRVLITVEENAIGGFSAQVSHLLHENGAFDGIEKKPLVFRSMMIPDRFIEAAEDPSLQYDDAELNASDIMAKIFTALNQITDASDAVKRLPVAEKGMPDQPLTALGSSASREL
jgi:1-deoxy-D-xylulose-5-phosphate synthase